MHLWSNMFTSVFVLVISGASELIVPARPTQLSRLQIDLGGYTLSGSYFALKHIVSQLCITPLFSFGLSSALPLGASLPKKVVKTFGSDTLIEPWKLCSYDSILESAWAASTA